MRCSVTLAKPPTMASLFAASTPLTSTLPSELADLVSLEDLQQVDSDIRGMWSSSVWGSFHQTGETPSSSSAEAEPIGARIAEIDKMLELLKSSPIVLPTATTSTHSLSEDRRFEDDEIFGDLDDDEDVSSGSEVDEIERPTLQQPTRSDQWSSARGHLSALEAEATEMRSLFDRIDALRSKTTEAVNAAKSTTPLAPLSPTTTMSRTGPIRTSPMLSPLRPQSANSQGSLSSSSVANSSTNLSSSLPRRAAVSSSSRPGSQPLPQIKRAR